MDSKSSNDAPGLRDVLHIQGISEFKRFVNPHVRQCAAGLSWSNRSGLGLTEAKIETEMRSYIILS